MGITLAFCLSSTLYLAPRHNSVRYTKGSAVVSCLFIVALRSQQVSIYTVKQFGMPDRRYK